VITQNNIVDALTKCTGYDSAHCPQPSRVVVAAWLEHFSDYPDLERGDLLEAAKVYHSVPRTEQLQPAHLSRIARDLRRDRLDRGEASRLPGGLCRECGRAAATAGGWCESCEPDAEPRRLSAAQIDINRRGREKVRAALAEVAAKRAARGGPPRGAARLGDIVADTFGDTASP
jgi:hypothetical protein